MKDVERLAALAEEIERLLDQRVAPSSFYAPDIWGDKAYRLLRKCQLAALAERREPREAVLRQAADICNRFIYGSDDAKLAATNCRDAIMALQSSPARAHEPEMVMVPREPTKAMVEAGYRAAGGPSGIYRAMCEAGEKRK